MTRELTQSPAPTRQFAVQLSSTARGARLARILATERLRDWGIPSEDIPLVVGELAANAARHGRVPGRDFRLSLTVRGGTLRIEVTDARADRVPVPQLRPADAESGRGLLLVEVLTDRWGVDEKQPAPCKTVWAEITLPTASRLPRRG